MNSSLENRNISNISYIWDEDGYDYWTHFGAPSSLALYINAVLVGIITVASIVLNGATLWVYYKQPKLNALLRPYVICLSISDLVSPIVTYWMNVVSSVEQRWLFGQTGCTVYGVIQGYGALVSITIVAAVAVERWQSLSPGRSQQAAKSTIAACWLYPIPASLPPVFGWSRYTLTGLLNTCCFDFVHRDWETRSFILFISIYGFLVPVIVTGVCYTIVGRAVLRRSAMLRDRSALKVKVQETDSASNDGLSATAYKQVAQAQRKIEAKRFARQTKPIRIMSLVGAAFLLAWTPYALAAYVAQFGPKYIINPMVMEIMSLLAKSSTTFNPIIYLCTDSAFQECIYKTVCLSIPIAIFFQIRGEVRAPSSTGAAGSKFFQTEKKTEKKY